MANTTKWRVVAVLLVGLAINSVDRVKASEDVMKKMSKTFFSLLEECKKELSIEKDMIEALVRFWTEDTYQAEKDLGCVFMCMAHKQDLLHADKNLMHHENAYQFARDHGADEDTAKQIVSFVLECEEIHTEKEDHCLRILEVSRCFRNHMHRLKWAPPIEVLIKDILVDLA